MRFAREPVIASVPYAYDMAWNQVREPEGGFAQVVTLVAGATLCIPTLVLWLVFAPFNPVHIDYGTLFIAIAIVALMHEMAHAFAFTLKRGSSELRVACALRKWHLSVRYEGAISRGHYVLVLVAPFLAVSLLPIALAFAASWHSGDLVLISMLNALVSGSDFIAALLVLAQVPPGALLRRQGDALLWRSQAGKL